MTPTQDRRITQDRGRIGTLRTALTSAVAMLLLIALPGACANAAGSAVAPLPASDYTVRPVCAAPAPGYAGCLALELVPITAAARAHTHPLGITRSAPIGGGQAAEVCKPPTAGEGCYGLRPQDLHSIYQLPTGVASVQTIALVDAYNDPNAEADLAVYDKEFGLPECTGANKCFEQINQNGEPGNLPFPASNAAREAEEAICNTATGEAKEAACNEVEEADGWSEEISLDIEVSHATCQNCRIMLVEADSASFPNLEAAEKRAARLGATEISNSWGGPERGETPALDDRSPFDHPRTVITAAAGDDGYLDWDAEAGSPKGFADYPASSPHVVAVGGTRLQGPLGAGGTWVGETVWNGDGAGGGGCSVELAAAPWQQNTSDWAAVGCGEHRAVADVSADADPYTGVAVYDSISECRSEEGNVTPVHWCTIGGTSLASPLVASVFALAGGAGGVEYPAKTLYENEVRNPSSLHDVISGSNGACSEEFDITTGLSGCTELQEAASCSEEAICLARAGYDGPTGVGTPAGIAAFQPSEEAKQQTKAEEERRSREAKEAEEKSKQKTEEERRAESEGSSKEGGTAGKEAGEGGAESKGNPPVYVPIGVAALPNSTLPTEPPTAPGSSAIVPILSAPVLTRTATAALNHGRPRASMVAFAFTLNVAARVHVTLAKLLVAHGRKRWQTLQYSRTIAGASGRDRARLSAHGRLAPGSYRLTLTPVHGTARTLTFKIG